MRAPLPPPVRAVLALLALVLVVFTKDRADSWADGSRLGTIQGLVEHGTLALDDTDFLWQGDKVRLHERFYSHQPPMLALAGALPYGLLHHVFGRGITDAFTYRILTWCLVGLPVWFGAVALARLLLASGCGPRWSALLLFLAVFGTHLLPYSLVLGQHGAAAGLVLLAFGALADGKTARAGVLMAFASTIDLSAAFPAALGALPALRLWGKDGGLRYALGALPPLALHFGVNFGLVGDFVPIGLHLEAFEYPYSPFMLMALTGGEHAPGEQLAYLWRATFGYSGFFSHHPVTLLSVLAALALPFVRGRRPTLAPSLLVAAALSVLSIGGFYLWSSRNFGGSAFGMRWFTVFSPLLALFPAAWLGSRPRPWRPGAGWKLAISIAALWSVAAATLGAVQPWNKFAYFPHQKPDAALADPGELAPNWPTHLAWEWKHLRSFRMRFDREAYLQWFYFLLKRHGEIHTLPLYDLSDADQRAWTRRGLDRLRPVVDLLDSVNEASDARIIGHYWLARMHALLGEREQALREYDRTLGLRPGHALSLKGKQKLEPDRGADPSREGARH